MKKVIFGGLVFVGGAVMCAVGALGVADTAVQAQSMLYLQYFGMLCMVAGMVLGVVGLKKD